MPDGYEIDHINGNRLDNRAENLRLASHAQNMRNVKKLNTNKTGFKGVSLLSSGKYRAVVNHEGRQIHVGVYSTPGEADAAARVKREELHGEFCRHE